MQALNLQCTKNYCLEATLLRLLSFALAVTGLATAASVGVVTSTGDIRVDGSSIRGNGTISEGSVIETAQFRSSVQLGDVRITLLPDSRLKAYSDHATLEKGWGIVNQGMVEVGSLQIAPAKGSETIVQMTSPKNVNVVAEVGDAQVRNAQGVLLANLRTGMGMSFAAQAAGSQQVVTLAGQVAFENNKCSLTEASKPPTTYEVQGWPACKANAKKYVKVQGTLIAPGVVKVDGNTAKVIGAGDAGKIAAAGTGAAAATAAAGVAGTAAATAGVAVAGAAAAGAGAAAGGAALGAGAIAAIAGGAVAAGLGAAAATGAIGGSSSP